MKVVILCGGKGTRIRDVSSDVPKPMIQIGSYPILWHIMKCYARHGFKDFVICLGYKGQSIKDFFLNYRQYTCDLTVDFSSDSISYHTVHAEMDWKVTLIDTGLDTMTGGRISRIKKYIGDAPFMFTYGDGVSDVDIASLVKFHQAHERILTVTGVQPPGRFGEMLGEKDGLITGFQEKPKHASSGRISGGFFVANPQIFDYLSDDEDLVFEDKPMKMLVKDHQLMMYEHNGFWHPMDTSREYQLLNTLYAKGEAAWLV